MRAVQNWRIQVLAERHIRRAVKHASRKSAAAILSGGDATTEKADVAEGGDEGGETTEVPRMKGETEEEQALNAEAETKAAADAAEFAFDASSASLQVKSSDSFLA